MGDTVLRQDFGDLITLSRMCYSYTQFRDLPIDLRDPVEHSFIKIFYSFGIFYNDFTFRSDFDFSFGP